MFTSLCIFITNFKHDMLPNAPWKDEGIITTQKLAGLWWMRVQLKWNICLDTDNKQNKYVALIVQHEQHYQHPFVCNIILEHNLCLYCWQSAHKWIFNMCWISVWCDMRCKLYLLFFASEDKYKRRQTALFCQIAGKFTLKLIISHHDKRLGSMYWKNAVISSKAMLLLYPQSKTFVILEKWTNFKMDGQMSR